MGYCKILSQGHLRMRYYYSRSTPQDGLRGQKTKPRIRETNGNN